MTSAVPTRAPAGAAGYLWQERSWLSLVSRVSGNGAGRTGVLATGGGLFRSHRSIISHQSGAFAILIERVPLAMASLHEKVVLDLTDCRIKQGAP